MTDVWVRNLKITFCKKETKHHKAGFVQKPNYLTLLTSMFFLFHQQFLFKFQFFINKQKTDCVYNRSNPYSTKHSQGKNEHFLVFRQRFSSPPFPLLSAAAAASSAATATANAQAFSDQTLPLPPAARVGEEDVCLSGCDGPRAEEESIHFDGWGGVWGGLYCFFLIQTDNQLSKLLWQYSRYNGVSINTHSRTAGSLQSLGLVDQQN